MYNKVIMMGRICSDPELKTAIRHECLLVPDSR